MNEWVNNMGRKPDPKGKDRPRSIVLSGDVAEIAQRLADKNVLSSTLSALLRKEFGVATALEAAERELKQLIAEREENARAQELAVARIDELQRQAEERKTTVIPAIELRLEKLWARRKKTEDDMKRLFTPRDIEMKKRVIANIDQIITATEKELEDLS